MLWAFFGLTAAMKQWLLFKKGLSDGKEFRSEIWQRVGSLPAPRNSPISIALGFLNVLVAARFLLRKFGVYILIQVIISFYTMVGDLGLNISTAKFVASAEDDSNSNCEHGIVAQHRDHFLSYNHSCWNKKLPRVIFKTKLLSELIVYISMLVILENLFAFFASALQGSSTLW